MIAAAVFLAAALAAAPSPAPHAGQESRAIKALSAEDVASYLAGEGMGLARAAELNHFPGPRHVLELRADLALTAAQARIVQASFDEMSAEARRLGAAIVDAEQSLDARFARGDLDAADVDRAVAAIAALQGKLRAAHLRAHLATRAALTPEQVARYDALRGYAHGAATDHGHH